MIAPRRRWYSFSLRTLFVAVTLVCVVAWVFCQLKWIRERHYLFTSKGGVYYAKYDAFPNGLPGSLTDTSAVWHGGEANEVSEVSAPWQLRLFGEPGCGLIVYFYERDEAYLRRLFPESRFLLRRPQ
jgi:hypothetical protein